MPSTSNIFGGCLRQLAAKKAIVHSITLTNY